jgi:broad specificity phosphatase PhoE
MEPQLPRANENLKVKSSDIKKTLEMVKILLKNHQKEGEEEEEMMETNFLILDSMWAKAEISYKSGKVGLTTI